jgi:hypothetical protein
MILYAGGIELFRALYPTECVIDRYVTMNELENAIISHSKEQTW